jgi:hypothetical protein
MSNKKANKNQSKEEDMANVNDTLSTPPFSPTFTISNVSTESSQSSKRQVELNIFPTPHPKKSKWAIQRAVSVPDTIQEDTIETVANPEFEASN